MKRKTWNKKQLDTGQTGGAMPGAGELLDGKIEARKTRRKKAQKIGSESVAELREELTRAEEMIESCQLQLGDMRRQMHTFHKRSIVDGLTTRAPSAVSITHGEADEETVHAFLEMSMEEAKDAETVFLPMEFASPVFYGEWEKLEDTDAMIDYVLEELGADGNEAPAEDGKDGVETGEYGEDAALGADVEELRSDKGRLQEELDRARMQYEVVKRLSVEREDSFSLEAARLEGELAEAREEVEKARDYAAEIKRDLNRYDTERNKLHRDIEAKEAEIRRLRKEFDDVLTPKEIDIGAEAPLPEPAAARDGEYEKTKGDLVVAMQADSSMETIFALRHLFLSEKQYEDGIGVFRKMLTNSRNNKFLPAIYLVVGEMFKRAGRVEEANFYLTNPLIRNDSFAQHLLRKMKL